MTGFRKIIKASFDAHPFVCIVLAVMTLYALIGLTPSSYAIVLRTIGVEPTGMVLGPSRPTRSDEWAVWTPYIQIAVNNGFARFNAMSPYGEDLRNFNALPLADWAIVFKPQFWAFFVLPPAMAYSLMYAISFTAGLTGWYLVGLQFGFERRAGAIFSLSICCLPYVQLWLTTTGPLIGFLPWVLLAYLVPQRNWLRALLVAYTTAVLLLSHFYVPFCASLAYCAAFLLVAMRRDSLRIDRLIFGATGAALGAAVAIAYLWEPMQVMAATIYPGHRTSVAGGSPDKAFVLGNLFPHFLSNGRSPFIWNELEIGTGASYAILFVLLLLDYRRLEHLVRSANRAFASTAPSLAILGVGAGLILVWWLVPLPSWVGVPLMWNAMPAQRLAFAFGLLVHVGLFVLALRIGLVLTLPRLLAGFAIVVAAALMSKFVLWHGDISGMSYDLLIVGLLSAVYWWRSRIADISLAILTCAMLSNAIVFATYNPLQHAAPIFAKHDTPFLRALAEQQARDPRHWLLASTPVGTSLNGLGFRAIEHTLIAPQLAFFRKIFPEMPDAEFNHMFNRYAHIHLDSSVDRPTLSNQDLISVPLSAFE
jgi:hypothetical protein